MGENSAAKKTRIPSTPNPFTWIQATRSACSKQRQRRNCPSCSKVPPDVEKTRFVEYMAFRLKRPLITVACHEDLFASDLIGRYLLKDDETVWVDGPLDPGPCGWALSAIWMKWSKPARIPPWSIHPLTDNRRTLSIDKKGRGHPGSS